MESVDPLASNKGFWAEVLGVGDFYYELAVQIVEICLATRSVNGGLMALPVRTTASAGVISWCWGYALMRGSGVGFKKLRVGFFMTKGRRLALCREQPGTARCASLLQHTVFYCRYRACAPLLGRPHRPFLLLLNIVLCRGSLSTRASQ